MNKMQKSLLILLFWSAVSSACGQCFDRQFSWKKETRLGKNFWSSEIFSDELFWQDLKFPKNFLWGAATSAFQIEGAEIGNGEKCKSSWTQDASKHQPGTECDHWNRYIQDAQLIKDAGLNSYRLSVCWSKIEPEKGVFNKDVMDHYIDEINELCKRNIMPIVCLFHHEWPAWFDKLDAFEKEENIHYFVEYAVYVFEKLHDKVPMWMTFNEPVGYALEGYFRGLYPPNKKDLGLCGRVVKNMLNAHVAAYQACKKIDNAPWIGLPKVFNPLDPYTSYSPIENIGCKFFSYLLHDVALNFFKTGKFSWPYYYKSKKAWVFKHKIKYVKDYNPDAPNSLDYLGVNYYSHTVLRRPRGKFKPEPVLRDCEQRDDVTLKRAIYPEGLMRSIKKASKLGLPMLIAENGVNDASDTVKNEYIKQHLWIIKWAMQAGYPIFGYHMWTLFDGFSWSKGSDTRMGLYNNDRILYEQSKPFVNYLRSGNWASEDTFWQSSLNLPFTKSCSMRQS